MLDFNINLKIDHFDLPQCLEYIGRNRLESSFHIYNNRLSKLFLINGEQVLTYVEPNSDGITLHYEYDLDRRSLLTIKNYYSTLFDLNADYQSFWNRLHDFPNAMEQLSVFNGFRICRIPDFFECASWTILGQQINLNFAYSTKLAFVNKYGTQFKKDNIDYHIFPHPQNITHLDISDFRSLKISRQKATYIIGVAKLLQSSTLGDLDQFINSKGGIYNTQQVIPQSESKRIVAALLKIKGIGLWSAHYIAMRCFGMQNVFPLADAGLKKAVPMIFGSQYKDKESYNEFVNQWGDSKGVLAAYLWRYLASLR